MTRHKTLRGLIREEAKKPELELQCQAPKSGVSPEVEALVLGAMRNNSRSLEAAAESLYQMALHFLVRPILPRMEDRKSRDYHA